MSVEFLKDVPVADRPFGSRLILDVHMLNLAENRATRRAFALNQGFPLIVVLCGSARFEDAFREASASEGLAGRIVLSISGNKCGDDDREKAGLDRLHFRKIELADECLILNVGGYIGESTRRELDYARSLGKPVRFLVPVEGMNI